MGEFLQSSPTEAAAESLTKPYDAIVVGGGTSGMAVAATLVQRGRRVILIDAGPASFLTHLQNTELRFAPALLRALRDRVRYRPALADGEFFGTNFGCLGGRGLFWNGASPRFSASDFAAWPVAAVPTESDYAWAEVQFRVTRQFGETNLARRLNQALSQTGISFEPGPYAVETGSAADARLGSGVASAFGFFFRIAGAAIAEGRLRVLTDCLVHRIVLDGTLAKAVEVAGDEGAQVQILGTSIVLAAGGIESIKLAALSGLPDPAGRIGKGLQEHIFYNALLEAPQHYDPRQVDTAILYARAPTIVQQQWELHAPGNRMFAIDDGTNWQPAAGAPYQIMIRSFAGTEKRDANHVESQPGGLGSATVHFSYTPRDQETMEAMKADALRIAAALDAAPADAVPLDAPQRIRAPGSSYHEAGGLDMGIDLDRSVTDPSGVFHAVPNLVSADAASFPMIGATNPHLTLLASARRKALALNERLNA